MKEAASALHRLRNPGAPHIADSLLQLLSTISIKNKISTKSPISFKSFTSLKLDVVSDLSKIGNFLTEGWGKLFYYCRDFYQHAK